MVEKVQSQIAEYWQNDLNRKQYIRTVAVLIVLKLILVACQMIEIFPEGAPVDDELMFSAAQSLGEGNWLGSYNWATMAKSMGFAVYLWAVHTLHIPYLLANALLWAIACIVSAASLSPVFRRRVERLAVFFVLWFSPFSTAQFTLRVYRDSILPQLILLSFSGVLGFCLRSEQSHKKQLPWAALAGVSAAACYLVRDDAIWIFPFVICAFFAWALWVLLQKKSHAAKALRISSVLLALALCFALPITAYCGMNYKHYGRFIINETSAPEFTAALSAMQMADCDLPHAGIAVCYETRQKIYAVSPTAAKLGANLENEYYYHGAGWPELREFNSGGFFWAVRHAAFDAGLAKDAAEAETFYATIADELNAAYEAGTLAIGNHGTLSSFLVPWHDSFLKPTLKEIGNSLRCLLFFEQTSSLAPLSIATLEQAAVWENYTYTMASKAAIPYTSDPYYYPHQLIAEGLFTIIRWCYRILIWPALLLFGIAMIRKFKGLFSAPKTWFGSQDGMIAILTIGLVMSSLLRIVLIAYIEANNFRIGTYLLYLSGSGMLTVLCAAMGTAFFLQHLYKKQNKDSLSLNRPSAETKRA